MLQTQYKHQRAQRVASQRKGENGRNGDQQMILLFSVYESHDVDQRELNLRATSCRAGSQQLFVLQKSKDRDPQRARAAPAVSEESLSCARGHEIDKTRGYHKLGQPVEAVVASTILKGGLRRAPCSGFDGGALRSEVGDDCARGICSLVSIWSVQLRHATMHRLSLLQAMTAPTVETFGR